MKRPLRPLTPIEDRITKKIRICPESSCWIWTGAFSKKRRGRRPAIREGRRGSRVLSVQRWICEKTHGPAPSPEHEAGHTCPHGEREDCVSPDHLVWMSRTENEHHKRTYTHDDTSELREESTT